MSKEIIYVGVDVGQEELWVAIEGKKIRSFRHTVSGIKSMWEWVRKVNPFGTLHFCLEATGVYSLKLAACLSDYSDTQVSIVNPAQISSFAKALLKRSKTDRVDAQVILAFAQSQHPQVWEPPSQVLQQLYELVVQAESLKKTQRQWANRKHTQAYIPHLPKEVSQTTKALQKYLEKQIAQVEKAIKKLCETDPLLKAQMKLLCTIPGVKESSAAQLLAYGKTALTNYSAKALVAHSGLAPKHKQSGISVRGRSHLAKLGDKRLRTALYMPALVGSRYNPILQQYYQKLTAKGKPKMLALIACMKKLLLIIRAILIKQTTFNPNFQTLLIKKS